MTKESMALRRGFRGLTWQVAMCGALAWHAMALRHAMALPPTLTRFLTADQFVTAPPVEILFPPDDHLHAATEISIEVALRSELLGDGARDADRHVCVGMTTVAVDEDVALDEAAARPQERCYDARDEGVSVYTVTGLVPGARYAVSAGLIDCGKVVAHSMRSFEVASLVWWTPGDASERTRMSVPDALRHAYARHVDGDRTAATDIYRKVVDAFPHIADALHWLGLALFQDGDTAQAVEFIDRALVITPDDAIAHVSMAICLRALGRTDDAIGEYRRALELRPSYVHAALGLGALLSSQSKWDEALHEFRKVVSTANDPPPPRQVLEPRHEDMVIEALTSVCEILRLSDGPYEAERCLAQATKRFPDQVRFHIDRGHVLLYGGQFEAAQREYEAAAQLGSVHGMTHAADVLEAMGDYEGSIRRYHEVLQSPNTRASTVFNQIAVMMTTVLPRILPGSQDAIDRERQRFRENVDAVISSISHDMNPVYIDPSRIAFSTAVSMNAHHRNNRELKRALGVMYYGLWIDPGHVHEDYVSSSGITPIPYHQEFRHDPPMPAGRLRVGFVSRFLYNSAVGLFMNELLPQLNATKYEVFAFGVGLSKSVKKYEQVPQIAEHVVALPRDLRIARHEISAHQLDVLIYPELGMDKTTYFLAYHRLAPVQAAWWGNPDTTGVPTIDYFIASEYEHRDFRYHYTETVHQMKGLGIYHTMPPLPNSTISREDIRRAVQERFGLASDFRFYLSIESILHMHPDFDEALRRILERDPLAHIFLLASSNRKSWKQQLLARLAARVDTARVLFFTDVDQRQELLLLGAADAVLASLHVTRAKAAMQVFTAGVPVVTLAGELWASCVTAAFYRHTGVRGLTARSLDEYADLAVRLATDDAFRERMASKIRRARERLSKDQHAVAEWERFFDVAAARVRRNGGAGDDDEAPYDWGDDEEVEAWPSWAWRTEETDEQKPPEEVELMTCPATSLQHLL